MNEALRGKYGSWGSWGDSNPFLVESFLEGHFTLRGLVEEANRAQEIQGEELSVMRSRLEAANNKYNNLLCFNRKMMDDNNQLIRTSPL